MKNLFDGSDDDLSPGQALVLMARQISWPSEQHQAQITGALEKEFDLVAPDPEPRYADPKDKELSETAQERDRLREEIARLKRDKQDRADADELEHLRRERDALNTPAGNPNSPDRPDRPASPDSDADLRRDDDDLADLRRERDALNSQA